MRTVTFRGAFLALCAMAALAPFAHRPPPVPVPKPSNWPATFEGQPLQRVPLSATEQKFGAGFPGEIARFSDGNREFIFRRIAAGTRKLHPAADCFRGLGYEVHGAPMLLDSRGARWNCFTAIHGPHRIHVRERICTTDGAESWTDVSAWYWSTLLGRSHGPWLAVTVVENTSG